MLVNIRSLLTKDSGDVI